MIDLEDVMIESVMDAKGRCLSRHEVRSALKGLEQAGYAVVPAQMDYALYSKVHGLADALYNGDAFEWQDVLPQLHAAMIEAAREETPADNGTERLTLKWGTLKGWDLQSDKSLKLMKKYLDLGASYSVMAQKDTAEQKQIICDLIDAIDGPIHNDWSGETLSKTEAKKYVLEYGQ